MEASTKFSQVETFRTVPLLIYLRLDRAVETTTLGATLSVQGATARSRLPDGMCITTDSSGACVCHRIRVAISVSEATWTEMGSGHTHPRVALCPQS